MKRKLLIIGKVLLLFVISFVFYVLTKKFPVGSFWFWVFTLFNFACIFLALKIIETWNPKQTKKQPEFDLSSMSMGILIGITVLALLAIVSSIVGLIKLFLDINLNTFKLEDLIWFVPMLLYLGATSMFKRKKSVK